MYNSPLPVTRSDRPELGGDDLAINPSRRRHRMASDKSHSVAPGHNRTTARRSTLPASRTMSRTTCCAHPCTPTLANVAMHATGRNRSPGATSLAGRTGNAATRSSLARVACQVRPPSIRLSRFSDPVATRGGGPRQLSSRWQPSGPSERVARFRSQRNTADSSSYHAPRRGSRTVLLLGHVAQPGWADQDRPVGAGEASDRRFRRVGRGIYEVRSPALI